jgi:hypothetical protein
MNRNTYKINFEGLFDLRLQAKLTATRPVTKIFAFYVNCSNEEASVERWNWVWRWEGISTHVF